jgi:peptidoglycan/LPS O-acetylase OafA/YrhL
MFGPYKIASSLHSDKYRPDIDGLRAIAVLSVVICHAFPDALPGGFIGVDVFFVLSGYLISSIIINDLNRDRFSIINFYDRRIRRIFPALITTLLATLLIGWALMTRTEFITLGKHIAASTLFSENFVLLRGGGYFDTASDKKPLLHLWSLAVEEQFYIFWPLVLWLARRGHVKFLAISALLGLASFAVNLIDIHHGSTAAYYSPLGRLWELMVGACLAYIKADRSELLARFKNLQSIVGAVLLAAAFVLTNPQRDFPGFWALLPTLGTFLLLSGGEQSWINKHVLSAPPLVWFGLISYPLYLWHWPLLSYCHITFGEVSTLNAVILIALAIAAATLTFFFIERPFRVRSSGYAKPLALVAGMIVLLACGGLAATKVLSPRLRTVNAPTRTEWDFLKSRTAHFDKDGTGIYPLHADRAKQVLFIGDSHVAHYAERIDKVIGAAPDRPGAVLAIGGNCVPIDGVYMEGVFNGDTVHFGKCWAQRDKAFEMAGQSRFGAVVIGGAWNSYFLEQDFFIKTDKGPLPLATPEGRAAAFQRLGQRIAALVKSGKRVVLVLDNPQSRELNSINSEVRLSDASKGLRPNRTVHIEPRQRALQIELAEVGRRAGAEIVDPFAAVCKLDECQITSDTGHPLYKDSGHFNPDWAVGHADFIDMTTAR